MGAGIGYLKAKLNANANAVGLVPATKLDKNISEKKYASYIGEWSDGDAIAAHYGYGFDYFCTNDMARGAGIDSIFSAGKLAMLNKKFLIEVVTFGARLLKKMVG